RSHELLRSHYQTRVSAGTIEGDYEVAIERKRQFTVPIEVLSRSRKQIVGGRLGRRERDFDRFGIGFMTQTVLAPLIGCLVKRVRHAVPYERFATGHRQA